MRSLKFPALALALALSLLAPSPATADGPEKPDYVLELGIGTGGYFSEYRDYNFRMLPSPLVHFESKLFYLRGLTGGFKAFADENHELSVIASYMPQSFYADQSDDERMKRLDDRQSSMFAGLSYSFTCRDWGMLRASLTTDVLGVSGGVMADVSYVYPISLGQMRIAPFIGAQWTDANYNQYYYGVEHSESVKSGLREYDPESCVSPYAGIDLGLPITEKLKFNVGARFLYLTGEINDSPMVERDVRVSIGGGVNYSF